MPQKELAKLRQECQVFTRVCGWMTPKASSNPGKQSEYKDRKMYGIQIAMDHQFVD